ncbi:hypothetical protein AVEN_80946-1 [Araneus ventricosus]|uniref:Uncharacterized protein n=1 Tax=Araneus ventricosus TaxID=182803 RepID=A0A4Y2PJI1_ARAVE
MFIIQNSSNSYPLPRTPEAYDVRETQHEARISSPASARGPVTPSEAEHSEPPCLPVPANEQPPARPPPGAFLPEETGGLPAHEDWIGSPEPSQASPPDIPGQRAKEDIEPG